MKIVRHLATAIVTCTVLATSTLSNATTPVCNGDASVCKCYAMYGGNGGCRADNNIDCLSVNGGETITCKAFCESKGPGC